MLTLSDVLKAQELLRDGVPPSEVARRYIGSHPDTRVPEVMQLLQVALGLPYESVQCLGGWWHDGTGELSDVQLDGLLRDALAQVAAPPW